MNFQTLLDYLGPELGLGLEVGLGLGFWLGEGGRGERRRREETGEGERGGSGGKGKEEEESGKHLPEPSRFPPLCLLEECQGKRQKACGHSEAGPSHQGPEAALCEGSGSWLPLPGAT